MPSPPEAAGVGLGHADGKGRGDGGVDGVAAGAQHRESGLRRQRMGRGDDAARGGDRRTRRLRAGRAGDAGARAAGGGARPAHDASTPAMTKTMATRRVRAERSAGIRRTVERSHGCSSSGTSGAARNGRRRPRRRRRSRHAVQSRRAFGCEQRQRRDQCAHTSARCRATRTSSGQPSCGKRHRQAPSRPRQHVEAVAAAR